jgi:hypothetical protein
MVNTVTLHTNTPALATVIHDQHSTSLIYIHKKYSSIHEELAALTLYAHRKTPHQPSKSNKLFDADRERIKSESDSPLKATAQTLYSPASHFIMIISPFLSLS